MHVDHLRAYDLWRVNRQEWVERGGAEPKEDDATSTREEHTANENQEDDAADVWVDVPARRS